MDSNPKTVEEETAEIKALRVTIDGAIQEAKRQTPSRAVALVVTKLEEAKMWAGKRFEEIGRELPKEYQDKAE
jgi:hypothetical protein